MNTQLHPIQKQILLNLAFKPDQRYSDLRDENIENDLFNYHLQYLVKEKYIDKTEKSYKLTEEGLNIILLTDSKGNSYEGLRVSVLVYIIHKDKIIIHKQIREPYIGEITSGIAGKVLKGELLENAAKRKMLEETGLNGDVKFLGVLRRIVNHPKGLIDDGFFHVFVCTNPSGDLILENEFGQNNWADFSTAMQYQNDNVRTGDYSKQVVEKIINQDYSSFYFQEIVDIT